MYGSKLSVATILHFFMVRENIEHAKPVFKVARINQLSDISSQKTTFQIYPMQESLQSINFTNSLVDILCTLYKIWTK